jgi:hypothetical protein
MMELARSAEITNHKPSEECGCHDGEAVLAEACHSAAKEAVARARVFEFIRRVRLQPISLSNESGALEAEEGEAEDWHPNSLST